MNPMSKGKHSRPAKEEGLAQRQALLVLIEGSDDLLRRYKTQAGLKRICKPDLLKYMQQLRLQLRDVTLLLKLEHDQLERQHTPEQDFPGQLPGIVSDRCHPKHWKKAALMSAEDILLQEHGSLTKEELYCQLYMHGAFVGRIWPWRYFLDSIRRRIDGGSLLSYQRDGRAELRLPSWAANGKRAAAEPTGAQAHQ